MAFKEYSKNDFLYSGFTNINDEYCKNTGLGDTDKALCDNKKNADNLMALTTTHSGASERYDNIRSFTNMSILNIFNLGIGIVATGVFIAQTYK